LSKSHCSIRWGLKRAQILEAMGKEKYAVSGYMAVLDYDKDQLSALNELGNLLLKLDKYDEAFVYLESNARKSDEPTAYYNHGKVYYQKRRGNEAKNSYQKAMGPGQMKHEIMPMPLVALGDIAKEQGKDSLAKDWYAEALERFDRIMEEAEPRRDRRAQRAVCLAKLGHFPEAEGAIEKLFPQADEFPLTFAYAARIQALKGDPDQLFHYARLALARKVLASALLNDVAFIEWRSNGEYRQRRGLPVD
jgi:Flp pilus assembly protein TadD